MFSLLFFLAARNASACAVCFGRGTGSAGLFNGLWWGILLLLAVTMSMVGGIVWAIWHIERRRGAARDA